MKIRALPAALLAFSVLAVPAFADNHGMDDKKSVAELIETSDQHTTLEDALNEAGLMETLEGEGPFTVFAPTDDAFDALPEGTLEELMKPENSDKLKQILSYHVAEGKTLPASAVLVLIEAGQTRGSLTTMGGQLYINKEDDGSVSLEDEQGNKVDIVKSDLKASNGIVHVIDGVLMPGSN